MKFLTAKNLFLLLSLLSTVVDISAETRHISNVTNTTKADHAYIRSRRTAVELRTIYGYVKDRLDRPAEGVRVTAFDSDIFDDEQMGRAMTDSKGYYEIQYRGGHWDSCPHEWNCWRPDIYVTLSVRRWKVDGWRYEHYNNLPSCLDVKFGWERLGQSREYSDWRLKYALRIDLDLSDMISPRVPVSERETGDRMSDKPKCIESPVCYNFPEVKTYCKYEKTSIRPYQWLYTQHYAGCYWGYQIEWWDCLYTSGCRYWRPKMLPGETKCFARPPLVMNWGCNLDKFGS